ncbi:MAG: tetratricopeptide repeat protein, partial [Candidatus Marinimicrobia bacterium]|nr:tetratricopeptide repeat protein [Candidatus Neomarinimicrobiota bacterium]
MTINKTFQKFLEEVLSLAEKHCGKTFTKELQSLRIERERLLNNIWREDIFPEKLELYQKDRIYRDIDFDTTIHYAVKYLTTQEYLELLFEIAEISIKYGEFQKGEHLLQLIITKHRLHTDKKLLAKVQHDIGKIYFYKSDFKTATKYFNKSLVFFTLLSDNKGIAIIKNDLGALMVEKGHLPEGEELLKEAREMAEDEKFSEYIAKTNMNLGNISHMRGDSDDAINYYQIALDVIDKDAEYNYDTVALLYLDVALASNSLKQFPKALEYLHKSLDLSKKTNNKYTRGLSYLAEAKVYCYKGEYSTSTALATTAFSIFSEIGDRLSMAEAYKIFGTINRKSKRFDIALSYFENSKRINEELNNKLNLAETLVEIAYLYKDTGETSNAIKNFKLASKHFEKIGAVSRIESINKAIKELSP